jgi:glycosyltransferase involved in cell wall biosynthesis
MRILVANDGFGDAGGVQSYLDAVVPGLMSRGHDVATLHLDPVPSDRRPTTPLSFSVGREGLDRTLDAVRSWRPEICFSHNMRDLHVERHLMGVAPVAKFMHGYFGTCIGGQKMWGWPAAQPCARTFGAPCIALYFPRRCGEASVAGLLRQYRWACQQHDLLDGYHAILVASQHMRREFVRNGADARKVHVTPLFGGSRPVVAAVERELKPPTVAFVGRMTRLKGGDLLVRAVAQATAILGSPIELIMIGDGPRRAAWERLAAELAVRATFVGWQRGEARWLWLRRASVLAVPSVWPEPFGLVGLEAATLGVPSIAFDVGGVREWLSPGENGYLVSGHRPTASALADGLVAVLHDPDRLAVMGRQAAAAAQRMSVGRHLDRLEAIFAR